ncbi:MAG: thymidylate kinase [Oscillospiraceae bacterium]|nr:thymidylate kinase [Oscillospiraceae bacterium]
MRGKLITIEGTDCSGKSTQLELLAKRLQDENVNFRKIAFPRYDSESSALVRMYLGGEFGENVSAVNAYTASSFFAVDRAASYLREWKTYLDEGGNVLLDRYTTSNAIYQASKLPERERKAFCDWLFDFEYNLLGLPSPDAVIFLDMPPQYAEQLMKKREESEDIHEKDKKYLATCYASAVELSEKYSWKRISCTESQRIKTIEEIHSEIYKLVSDVLSEGKYNA